MAPDLRGLWTGRLWRSGCSGQSHMRLFKQPDNLATLPPLEEWDGDDEPLAVVALSAPAPAQPERVLLVEDDVAIRRLYRLMLEKRGFDVVDAADGQEAMLYAGSGTFDLVIADLNMPKMDGWGLLSHLRQDCRTRDVPVAFLSCEDDFRESLRAQEVGARAYISKGTKLELIAQEVRLLCEPVRRLRRILRTPITEQVMSGDVGAVVVLRELAQAQWTGVLRAVSSWVQVELAFVNGRPFRASARSGEHEAQGPKAFNAFVACERFNGMLAQQDAPGPGNLVGSFEEQLEDAFRVVNLNSRRSAEAQLTRGQQFATNPSLYQLYTKLASPEARETARRVCEERMTPAQVIANTDRSPLEVDAELQELHRRGLLKPGAHPAAARDAGTGGGSVTGPW